MIMKRKLVETSNAKVENEEQDSTSKPKKKKKKSKPEFEVEEIAITLEEKAALNNSNVDLKTHVIGDDLAGSSGDKVKKSKKNKKVTVEPDVDAAAALLAPVHHLMPLCVLETGDEEIEVDDKAQIGIFRDVWPKDKILTLINRILEVLPDNDNLKYSSRMAKLDWESVSFDEYNGTLCQAMWKSIQERTRCYRLLKEVASDAKDAIQQSSSVFYHSMVKDKHPEMPVKPLSSFMLFYMDVKDKLSEENPGIGCPDIAKKVSELWKALPPKKSERYSKKAAHLKEEYKEKLDQFYKKHPEFVEEKKRRTKTNADSLGFEKPKSAFQLYYHAYREIADKKDRSLPPLKMLENAKEIWKTMAEDQKVVWIEAARKEEKDYLEKLKKYETDHPGSVLPTVKTSLTKNERHLLDYISGKPKKPPSNAYSLYSQLMLQSNSLKKLPSKERLTEISKRWKALDTAEKEVYGQKLLVLQDEYKKQFDEYVDTLSPEEKQRELDKIQVNKKKKVADKKPATEPVTPPTDIMEYYKSKHVDEWKKKFKNINEDEFAKKKWNSLSASAKQTYIEELRKLNDRYFGEYAKFLQSCGPDHFVKYLVKITDHRQRLTGALENISE